MVRVWRVLGSHCNISPTFTLLALISISLSDIVAYEFGRRFGKRKLAESISPNKTIEGFLMGLLAGSISMTFVLSNYLDLSITQSIIVALMFVSFGTIGDLFESRIKRSVEIKDSSSLLPGHGGVLDRIDSQLISFPLLVFVIEFLDLI